MALYDLIGQITATTGTGQLTLGAALPGHRTVAGSAIADGTCVSYSISSDSGAARETGVGLIGGSGTTLTRNFRSSSTGSLLNLSGSSEVYVSAISSENFQASLFSVSQYSYRSGADGSKAIEINSGWAEAGSPSNESASATTPLPLAMSARAVRTAASSGSTGAMFLAQNNFYKVGDGTKNGLVFSCTFSIRDAATISGAQAFVGLSRNNRFPNDTADPATYTEVIGVAQLASDGTQLYICYGGSVAQTPIALGSSAFPINPDHSYKFDVFCPPVGGANWVLTNLSTAAVAFGAVPNTGAALPATTSGMGYSAKRNNGSTTTVGRIFIHTIYIGNWI